MAKNMGAYMSKMDNKTAGKGKVVESKGSAKAAMIKKAAMMKKEGPPAKNKKK